MSTPGDPPVLRLRRARREHVTPVPLYLDALLPDDHLARLIWAAVERLDLSAFAAGIKVVEGGQGGLRPIRRCWWRCGSMRPAKGSTVRGRLPVSAPRTSPTSGCAGGSP